MNWNPTEAQEYLMLYALGALSDHERAQVEEQLQLSPEMRQELAAIYGDLTAYAMTSEMHAPTASSRQRLMHAIGREKRSAPPEPVAMSSPAAQDRPEQDLPERRNNVQPIGTGVPGEDRVTLGGYPAAASAMNEAATASHRHSTTSSILGWAGWAIAAGIGIFAFSLHQESRGLHQESLGLHQTLASRDAQIHTMSVEEGKLSVEANKSSDILAAMNDRTATESTLTRVGLNAAPQPTGHASYSPARGTVFFIGTNLEPLDRSKVYELWIIPADERDPIASGIFRPDAHGSISMITSNLPKGVVPKAFGITVEADGGSAKPTTPIILSGT
jgi:anti-sigma-K factor RskA